MHVNGMLQTILVYCRKAVAQRACWWLSEVRKAVALAMFGELNKIL